MFTVGQIAENCFLFRKNGSDRALIVDPGDEAERILGAADELGVTIDGILLTHTHFDHIGAVAELAEATRAPVHVPAGERAVLERADEIYRGFGVDVRPWRSDVVGVCGDEQLELAGLAFETVSVPGHSPDHVAYYSEPYLFSGDVLFAGSVGRVDLPGGNWEQLFDSIQELITRYDPDTIVFPGHGPLTTLGVELAGNPFLAELRAAR
jgi:hydroxyacylglutathione hydrolase